MSLPPTVPARAGTAVLGVLAMVQLVTALTSDAPAYAVVLLLMGCALSSGSAMALHSGGGLGARLAAFSASVLTGGGAALVAFAGLPGGEPSGSGPAETGTVLLSLSVLLLLALDARSRPASESSVPPYAL